MKVIDLLNKIANGERFEKCKMKFKEIEPEGVSEYVIYDRLYEEDLTLNDEVEIIEEEKDINFNDIEEFHISYNLGFINYRNIDILRDILNKDFQTIFDTLDLLINNQKKLIKEVNELKNKED